jgi:dihydrofolate reductase
MSERKIVAYIATSADGYIARSDGNVDWLNRPRTAGDYGMGEFLKSIDTVLFGRTTFDFAMKMGVRWGKKNKNYVFTHSPPAKSPHPQVEFVNEPVKDFATRLRASPGKDIWMMGGGGIIASFLDAGELDEFRIHVIPVFIGEGIPLIQPSLREVQLKLLSSTKYDDGVVRLHYSVDRDIGTKTPRSKSKSRTTKGK